MPAELPKRELELARSAVAFAQEVRALHRKRTARDNPRRQADIDLALERLKRAMEPLRSMIGRFPYGPQTTTAEENRQAIYAASRAIQDERRKLWKMKNV